LSLNDLDVVPSKPALLEFERLRWHTLNPAQYCNCNYKADVNVLLV
jgi:hypothetical protein